MAVFNEILVGRVNRFLQKHLGIKGGSPAPSLAGDVMTTLPLFVGIESLIHQGWDSFGLGTGVPNIAANFSKVQFRNPSGSNVIAVIDSCQCTIGGSTGDFQMRLNAPSIADLSAIVPTNTRLDNRGRTNPTCVLSTRNSDAVFITGQIIKDYLNAPANVVLELAPPGGILLLPDTTYSWAVNAINQGISVSLQWRERFLEETERT